MDQQHIEDLISGENDPKIRLQLMVMNRINLSLIANTQTTNDIATKLEMHVRSYEQTTESNTELLNKGRGAWKILVWVLSIAQLVLGGLWVESRKDIDINRSVMNSNYKSITELVIRVDNIEKRIK